MTALSLSVIEGMPIHDTRLPVEKNGAELISFKTWCIQQGSKVPQLKYLQTVYDMDMFLLRFERSIRTGDLFLYEKSWDEIAD